MKPVIALFLATISLINTPVYSEQPTLPCLEMTLEKTGQETNQEIFNICTTAFNHIKDNDYGIALNVVLEGLKQYPRSFALQTRLAMILGDYAGQFPDPDQQIMLQKSQEIFNKLYLEANLQSKKDMFYFKNEYYYRSALHKEQYENGLQMTEYYWELDEIAEYGHKGYYFQGVGAANYAKQLLLKNEKQLALEYAEKAIFAWAQYFSYFNTYYNAYVHYGLALGILGHKQDMMRALQRGADLIKTDLNFHEFKEIIEFVDHCSEEKAD
ncbi:MAG: hypothetical protein K2Y01_07805 [Rhabdochlamydiaceae bacterium]|nr:hypothetical protein [Rhabdochlamydiaceae bacterium]